MYNYTKPNVVVEFLDIERCSSIGEVVFQLSLVFLVSLVNHTLVACETTLVKYMYTYLSLADIVCLAFLMSIICIRKRTTEPRSGLQPKPVYKGSLVSQPSHFS